MADYDYQSHKTPRTFAPTSSVKQFKNCFDVHTGLKELNELPVPTTAPPSARGYPGNFRSMGKPTYACIRRIPTSR